MCRVGGSLICFDDPDIERLTLKTLVATEEDASPGLKTHVLKNTSDEEQICFFFFEWSVVEFLLFEPS